MRRCQPIRIKGGSSRQFVVERQRWNPKKHLTNTKCSFRLRLPFVREGTHLKIFAEGFGTGGTL